MYEENLTTADQDQWEEFSLVIRAELARRMEKIQDLNISDLHSLICCVRDAFWNDLNGKSYDRKLDRAQISGDTQ